MSKGCGCSRASKKKKAQVATTTVAEAKPKVFMPAMMVHQPLHIDGLKAVSFKSFQSELDSWLRSPYRHYSNNRKGVDCVNLVLQVLQGLKAIKPYKLNYYNKDWWTQQSEHPVFEKLFCDHPVVEIKKNYMPGDIMTFKFGKAERAHVGLYTIRDTIIHSVNGSGVIESSPNDKMWQKRISGALRLAYSLEGVE